MTQLRQTACQHALDFMAGVMACQKSRRENPDFDGFLRRVEWLGCVDVSTVESSDFITAYCQTMRVIAASAAFGMSNTQSLRVCEPVCVGV